MERDLLLRVPLALVARPVRVTFPVANAVRQVAHGLGDIPDGFHVCDQTAAVFRAPGMPSTKDLAFLKCATANTEATLVFFKFKETPINV